MDSSFAEGDNLIETEKRKRRPLNRRLAVILLVVFVQMVGASMVLPILPIYASNRFEMSPQAVTLLITSFFAAQFVAGPFIGRMSDQYGRLPVLIISQIGTVISFMLLGFAWSGTILFAARILDGITGGNIIVAQAYVTDVTPKEERTQSLGYIFAAFGVGFIFGPAIGGFLASQFSYETPYIVASIAAAITVILTWLLLDESLTPEERDANRQRKSDNEMSLRAVFTNLPLLSILAITFGSQFGFAMLQSTFALFGEAVIFAGESSETVNLGIGLLLATVGLGQLFTQTILLKRLSTKFSEASLNLIGTVLRGLSTLALVVFVSPYLAGISMFFFAVGLGVQMPALQSLATKFAPDNYRGGILGLYQSSVSLAIIIGSAIAGVLFAINPRMPYWVGAILFGLMTIPGVRLIQWSKHHKTDFSSPDPIANPVDSV